VKLHIRMDVVQRLGPELGSFGANSEDSHKILINEPEVSSGGSLL